MHIKGKLIATSFIAGAATALFASKQMNKNNNTMTSTAKNSYKTSHAKTSTYNSMPTAAETNNFYTKAPNTAIDYNYDINATNATSQTPYNVYFHNEADTKPAESTIPNAFTSINNSSNPNTIIKIDSI